jgi:hypothetical protein
MFRPSRASWWLLALFIGLFPSCKTTKDSTSLAVTVFSDIPVPSQLDGITIVAKGPRTSKTMHFPLTSGQAGDTYVLPVRTVLVPADVRDSAISVHIAGTLYGAEIVVQDVALSFLPDDSRELTVLLDHRCIAVACTGAMTCGAGTCSQPITIDPRSLPPYHTNQDPIPPDAAASVPGSDAQAPDKAPPPSIDGGVDLVFPQDSAAGEVASLDGSSVRRDVIFRDADTGAAHLDGAKAEAGPDGNGNPGDAACTDACSLGMNRCGSTGGLQVCAAGAAGCTVWLAETACGAHQECAASGGTAKCQCKATPAVCAVGAGTYCTSATNVQSCEADSDGCVYLGAVTTCSAEKPCHGTEPGKEGCACPSVAVCKGHESTSYCSGTDVVTCAANAAGCQVASLAACPTQKPCAEGSGGAACTCPPPPASCGPADGGS